MQDTADDLMEEGKLVASTTITGRVEGLFAARSGSFQTQEVNELRLTFEGIEGDFHAGVTRRSGGREPWYPRGTEIRNERQLSIVASDELAEIARRMSVREVKPEWIGANLVIEGVARLSMLPRGTLMFFANGVTLKIDAQNGPCRLSGRSIAHNAAMADETAGSLLFPKVARRLRGLVAWVEKPGTLSVGEEISLRLPEQWIYRV